LTVCLHGEDFFPDKDWLGAQINIFIPRLVTGNNIGPAGAMAIADALKINQTLQIIDLNRVPSAAFVPIS